MKLPYLVLVLCLWSSPSIAADDERQETPRGDRIYYFQHKLLPKWTFESGGAFFADLHSGRIARLLQAATDIVDAEFAKTVAVRPLEGASRVLIAFESPMRAPLCYFIIVEKTDEASFRFMTLEMTEDILGTGAKSVVGEWRREGAHGNWGFRSYTDEESFVSEITSSSDKSAGAAEGRGAIFR